MSLTRHVAAVKAEGFVGPAGAGEEEDVVLVVTSVEADWATLVDL